MCAMRSLQKSLVMAGLFGLCSLTGAQDPHGSASAAPHAGIEALSPPLRSALSQEMAALQNGMMQLIPAFASGQWQTVAQIGKQMQESFIIRQALSESQLDELHSALPEDFLELDADFHYLAGMLSHAASERKPELVAFYFGRMAEACVACHRRYATGKFPALATPGTESPHGH
jgi:hypothetical protein